MSEEANVIPLKRSLADEVRGDVAIAASKATQEDHKAVTDLVRYATGHEYSSEVRKFTSGMCALLFLNHNSHNRPWRPAWTLELARRQKVGLWKRNSEPFAFYVDGLAADGQHRMAMAAIANATLTVPVVFGLERDSIDTIDGGLSRSAADHAVLDGITEANRKQAIIKAAANYFVRAGDPGAALKSPAEVKNAIEKDDNLLTKAMDMGSKSRFNIATPQLKESTADIVAFVLLRSGWDQSRVMEKLVRFQQAGQSTLSDSDPLFVAAQLLEKRRKKAAKGEKLTMMKEVGIAIYALIETEKGVKAVQERHFRAAVDGKQLPDPRYPNATTESAVA